MTGTKPVSPPYFQQNYGSANGNVFSNGPTWVQNVSIALGLGMLSPSLDGGTDFAYGGAVTGSAPENTDTTILAISLPDAVHAVPGRGFETGGRGALHPVDRGERHAEHPEQPQPERGAAKHRCE